MKMDLSPTQKANIRKRLKAADDVVMKIQQSGVECNALVRKKAAAETKQRLAIVTIPLRLEGATCFFSRNSVTGVGKQDKETSKQEGSKREFQEQKPLTKKERKTLFP